MSENKDNIVILTDENGEDVEFEHLDTIEMNENYYVVLLPVEDEEEGVVILKMEEDENGGDLLVALDDDDEAEAVFQEFLAQVDEE